MALANKNTMHVYNYSDHPGSPLAIKQKAALPLFDMEIHYFPGRRIRFIKQGKNMVGFTGYGQVQFGEAFDLKIDTTMTEIVFGDAGKFYADKPRAPTEQELADLNIETLLAEAVTCARTLTPPARIRQPRHPR